MQPIDDVLHKRSGIPVQVDGEGMTSLSTCLFDLRAACETQLRTLTSVQRNLERVRLLGADAPESDLLLAEIARQLQELQNGSFDIARCHGVAERTFLDLREPRNGNGHPVRGG